MERTKIISLLKLSLPELISLADKIRRKSVGSRFEICSIMNAKSGFCGEDCKFCAQSSRHSAEIFTFPLKEKKDILKAAMRAKEIGAEMFGIVTSGNRLTKKELERITDSVSEIKSKVGIKVCASLGVLNEDELRMMRKAGLSRYHHNIETSKQFYRKIVSTHSFDGRIETIKAAKEAGLEVCSGGIIGMGESWQDRIELVVLLKKLDVDSIPINFLIPIKGTPLEYQVPISCYDAIKTICIFRIVLEDRTIKIAAGRESILKDFQATGFMAGANGMLIGGYLTVKGRDIADDWRLIREIKKIWRG